MNRVKSNPNGYKHVWIVYDTDDFPADRINKTNESCINLSTEETQYHAIWSNQCIELWFLLHFRYDYFYRLGSLSYHAIPDYTQREVAQEKNTEKY